MKTCPTRLTLLNGTPSFAIGISPQRSLSVREMLPSWVSCGHSCKEPVNFSLPKTRALIDLPVVRRRQNSNMMSPHDLQFGKCGPAWQTSREIILIQNPSQLQIKCTVPKKTNIVTRFARFFHSGRVPVIWLFSKDLASANGISPEGILSLANLQECEIC